MGRLSSVRCGVGVTSGHSKITLFTIAHTRSLKSFPSAEPLPRHPLGTAHQDAFSYSTQHTQSRSCSLSPLIVIPDRGSFWHHISDPPTCRPIIVPRLGLLVRRSRLVFFFALLLLFLLRAIERGPTLVCGRWLADQREDELVAHVHVRSLRRRLRGDHVAARDERRDER